ncbi:CDP-alcohol phosphatidyltransferase family protein [Sphingomonas turrisvirgatae]|uniref:CDP-diacylglycerol O-phosphatidyltransferase n=1 Tax=Sphingomonas turrisvirgatae TaxID=1888892 RepID=A0A1E3LQU6_9SPHN|nr:phosphatidylcholine/phosphatidylserine synthase [Sphingomonas turrisvirgatae]ODP36137.1 CDP-diacylglycerol O-phosphatidyltransferase [Sphingomonas turrisvirgatae]
MALRARSQRHGIPLRAVLPNAVTAMALCSGLTAVRFAIGAEWERAVLMIMLAAVLDGVDGQIARMIRGESRFGAELDSLSDAISFGVAPALILYLWSLIAFPKVGWIVALLYAVFCALRLARFNAQIDSDVQPRKLAGFLTGIPAPAGAGLAMLPIYVWLWSGEEWARDYRLVTPWVGLIGLLMVSSLATYSWKSLRLRRTVRFEALVVVAIVIAALVTAPWQTLTIVCLGYLATLPFSIRAYRRTKLPRAAAAPASILPPAAP